MIIAIEGGDQAGKHTQSVMLARALARRGHRTKTFHFPDYATPVGREIKRLLGSRARAAPELIHCLLAANRWERAGDIRRYARDHVLVMDRYYHSNVAYGMAGGLRRRWLEGLDAGLPRSDMVILLDVPPRESFRRKGSGRDRFERDITYMKKVGAAYRRLARDGRWKVIDASMPPKEVHERVLDVVLRRLK